MNNFNRIALVYDSLSRIVFGRRLQRAQALFLNQIPSADASGTGASVLVLGGGTGEILTAIFARQPGCHVLFLEPSARMVSQATRRVLRLTCPVGITFRVGNEKTLRSDEQFDAIITPFVLDLFTNETLQTHFIPCLQKTLKPNGIWLATDFVNTPVWWQRVLLWAMIRFFRLTAGIETQQLVDWQQTLRNAGLTRHAQQHTVWGMVSADVWSH